MNVQFRNRAEPGSPAAVKTAIADCDIHPARATKTELYPYLAKRWHEHLETYDKHPYQGMMEGPPYPKAQPNASRRDAYPLQGGPQGSSLSFTPRWQLYISSCSLATTILSCFSCSPSPSIRSPSASTLLFMIPRK